MGKRLDSITSQLQEFIQEQKIFFVGTAMREGRINLSPKGMDSFRVLGPNRIIWMNLTGSGNETATHLLESDRMTILFTAFEGNPLILRLYGSAKALHERDDSFEELSQHFPDIPGRRQIMDMQVDLVQTSCGFGVPVMEYKEDRSILRNWAQKKGKEGIREYWKEKNTISLDGHESHILD
ncbi:MAG: pyridoxamine 5'-phosphate oxidase family protein [Bacteroidota bacterium]